MSSKAMIGVNMLRIGDSKPQVLKRCLENVVKQVEDKTLDPTVAKVFKIDELAGAHQYLKDRKSIGKITVVW